MLGVAGLYEYFTGTFMPAGAACHLYNQLGHAFTGAEIGTEQTVVGIEDADQRYVREMMPLGEHLGTEQYTAGTGTCLPEEPVQLPLAPGGVAIDTYVFNAREMFCQGLLNAFSALADGMQVGTLA